GALVPVAPRQPRDAGEAHAVAGKERGVAVIVEEGTGAAVEDHFEPAPVRHGLDGPRDLAGEGTAPDRWLGRRALDGSAERPEAQRHDPDPATNRDEDARSTGGGQRRCDRRHGEGSL